MLRPGDTATTLGTSSRIAWASAAVSVVVAPPPIRTPPIWNEPADTVMTLVPRLWMREVIDARAPAPSAIITMTAATPMMMPSEVSAERNRLRARASKATLRTVAAFMAGSSPRPPPPGRRGMLGTSGDPVAGAAAVVVAASALVTTCAPSVSGPPRTATSVPSDRPARTRTGCSVPSTSCHTVAGPWPLGLNARAAAASPPRAPAGRPPGPPNPLAPTPAPVPGARGDWFAPGGDWLPLAASASMAPP